MHPKLKIKLRTIKRYKHYMNNTMTNNELIKCLIKSIINKIKLIKRASFGFRNYSNFRNKNILYSRLYMSEPKKID
ncbi:transposase [Staphylococcus sp. EG-SA-13]|nr:transposase [Staphylococcus sp. EG-SA-13]